MQRDRKDGAAPSARNVAVKTGPAHMPQRSSPRVCPASRPGCMVFGMAEQYRNPVSADSRYVTPDESSRLTCITGVRPRHRPAADGELSPWF